LIFTLQETLDSLNFGEAKGRGTVGRGEATDQGETTDRERLPVGGRPEPCLLAGQVTQLVSSFDQ
jgi:hypothetical protein